VSDWDIQLKSFLGALGQMPPGIRNGRDMRAGYVRGCALQFGNLADLCRADPVYKDAFELARSPDPEGNPRTIVEEPHLMNLFSILKMHLAGDSPGHIVEFGSMRGGSALFLAFAAKHLMPGSMVIAFDTFQGLPETDPTSEVHTKGDFGVIDVDALRQVAADNGLSNISFIEGEFKDTLPTALAEIGTVCLAHVDCDLRESVSYAYEQTKPYLVDGAYLVFDDPLIPTCLGAFEAVEELLVRRDGLHAEQVFPHLVYRYPQL